MSQGPEQVAGSTGPLTLEAMLARPPRFHVDGDGNQVSWQASDRVLEFIDRQVGPGSNTLETGEGVSTVLFALKGCAHTCISPDRATLARVRDYCVANGIDLQKVEFIEAASDLALPGRALPALDLLLVDGGHEFPMPFIDWHYAAPCLKVGGLLVVDDTQLWTGRVLKEFLLEEPGWVVEEDFAPRAVVFRRTADAEFGKGWMDQPYVLRRSRLLGPGRVGTGLELLRQRQYRTLALAAGRVIRRRGRRPGGR